VEGPPPGPPRYRRARQRRPLPTRVDRPEESQFLETTQANIRTIARYFGVQPELIGADSGNSLTYANVEQRALDFLTFGLRPWLVRLEVALSALLSSTTTVKFNAAALVRTDLLTRYQAHESAIRAGWKLRSEVRDLEDLPPVAGIDDQEGPAVA
jgi:HK97 family phage portal protein